MSSKFDKLLDTLIKRLMRSLVSLFIKNNVQFRRLCNLIKEVYVEVAAEEYGKGARPTNTTRIALLTGIDRKEVKRIRDSSSADSKVEPKNQSGALGRVLSGWYQDENFSLNGTPSALQVDGAFAALCKKYGGDITQTAILKELLRVNAVRRLEDESVVAVSRYYMPEKADNEAVTRSLDVFHDVGSTLAYNLYRPDSAPSRFEGRASNASIPQSRVKLFNEFVEQKGQQFLEEIDQKLTEYEEPDLANEDKVRLGIGLYLIENKAERPSDT
ncbi:MAG: DUF6502 family protein [Gammaproteobacteria bacterium]